MELNTPYRNIVSQVRTPRFAVLIDKNEKYWKAYVSGIVESFSQTWGGAHFIIIPTDGKVINDVFWSILEAYNPDKIGRYIPSILDMEEADPDGYESLKNKYRIAWNLPENEFEETWSKQSKTTQINGLGIDIDKSLSEQLMNRLSPFHFQDHVISENVFYGSPLGYPFTEIENIITSAKEKPNNVITPMKINDANYKLLSLSRAGALSDDYAKKLKEKGVSIDLLPDNSDKFRLKDYLSSIDDDNYQPRLRRIESELLGGGSSEYPQDNYISYLPFKLSMLYLSKYYRRDVNREDKERFTVVVGDNVEDYCLYYSLSRIYDGVHWMPDNHLANAHRKNLRNYRRSENEEIEKYDVNEDIAVTLVSDYFKAIRYGHSDKKINITSATLTSRQLIYRRKRMAEISYFGSSDFISHSEIIPSSEIPLDCAMHIIESNNYANQQDMIFQNNISVGRINTPKPKNFNPINPSDHRWITTLNVEGFCPPRLPFISEKIIQLNSAYDTRVARDGLAYLCPNIGYFGGDIDVVTVRPSLRLMSDEEIFNDYFANSGFSTELSDKGSYLKDTISRFGSLEKVAAFFRNESKRNLFDQFLIKKEERDSEVIYLDVEKRSYLSFEAFKRKLSGEEEAVSLIDELIKDNIISRGFIFQCSRCRLSAWYHVSLVGSEFSCSRCGLTQPYYYGNWKSPAEPRWYYRLAETVHLFYESSSHLTALALDKLRRETPDEFHYINETTINNSAIKKSKNEIDILAISKGNIILGECKNCPVVPTDIRKYLTIFSRLNIQPSQFLLVTTENSISDNVKAELKKFNKYRIFTSKDLYE